MLIPGADGRVHIDELDPIVEGILHLGLARSGRVVPSAPELPLGGADLVPGLREAQLAPLARGLARPADVVEVQVRVDDGVDLARVDSGRRKALEEVAAIEGPEWGNVRMLGAEAGVDQHLAVAGLDEQPANAGDQLATAIEPLRVELPLFCG